MCGRWCGPIKASDDQARDYETPCFFSQYRVCAKIREHKYTSPFMNRILFFLSFDGRAQRPLYLFFFQNAARLSTRLATRIQMADPSHGQKLTGRPSVHIEWGLFSEHRDRVDTHRTACLLCSVRRDKGKQTKGVARRADDAVHTLYDGRWWLPFRPLFPTTFCICITPVKKSRTLPVVEFAAQSMVALRRKGFLRDVPLFYTVHFPKVWVEPATMFSCERDEPARGFASLSRRGDEKQGRKKTRRTKEMRQTCPVHESIGAAVGSKVRADPVFDSLLGTEWNAGRRSRRVQGCKRANKQTGGWSKKEGKKNGRMTQRGRVGCRTRFLIQTRIH